MMFTVVVMNLQGKIDNVSSYHKSCTMRYVLLGSVIANDLGMYYVLSPIYFQRCTRKNVVPLPFTQSLAPCSWCPNSLEKYFTHVFLCLSCLLMCLY